MTDQSSLEALRQASSLRTEHEIATHGYHHIQLADERPHLPNAPIVRRKVVDR